MQTCIVRGFGLFGKDHAVEVYCKPDGEPYLPRRAKPPLCGTRRVMVTTDPFLTDAESSCKLCIDILKLREG